MARVVNNMITRGTTGTLGGVYYRIINGKTFISKMPVRRCPRSKNQKKSSIKFKKAVRYALTAMKNPEVCQIYKEASSGMTNVYLTAIGDYMKPPVVEEIDILNHTAVTPGHICILIKNIVQVKEVSVTVISSDGFVIASGQARPALGKNIWTYINFYPETEPRGFSVKAVATDLAGNKGVGKRHFPEKKPDYRAQGDRLCGATPDPPKSV
jgi:hypothetical protein